MARQSVVRLLTTTARTNGCRSRTWGWEAPEINEEACGVVNQLRGGRSIEVDGIPFVKEEAVGDGALLGVVADNSSSKVLLHLQQKTVVRFIGSDGDRDGWGGAR
jgi:hypothetical protein